ncbi:MAG: hypothetical protein Ct9H300mP19_01360 [Dehalococcoidia bacterium]|nr:MAG: hypothetical protein Ct9H300mP19_01360 [Dehalococcoidia bacterium]
MPTRGNSRLIAMTIQIASVPNGTVTSAKGFSAGAVFAGIKTPGPDKRDIGLLVSDKPCNVAGTLPKTASSLHPPASQETAWVLKKNKGSSSEQWLCELRSR